MLRSALIALALWTGATAQEPMRKALAGEWSSQGAYLWPGPTAVRDYPPGGRAIEVRSPDRSKVLLVADETMTLKDVKTGRNLGTEKIGDLAEILWAPDSRAFALTQSDGGFVGDWSVVVYRISPSGLRRREVTAQSSKAFLSRRVTRVDGCTVETPNFAAISWVEGSRRLLLFAESPPHSSACDMGVRGYIVDAESGAILRSYLQDPLYKTFPQEKFFGWRFTPAGVPR